MKLHNKNNMYNTFVKFKKLKFTETSYNNKKCKFSLVLIVKNLQLTEPIL